MTTPEHLTHFWGPVGTTTPLEQHHRRPAARRRLRDHHGQRRRRQHVHRCAPSTSESPARAAGVDRARRRRRHADHDHLRRPRRRAHRGGHPSDQRAGRLPAAPRRRPASPPASTASTSTWPVWTPRTNTSTLRSAQCQQSRQPTAPTIAYERTGSGPALVLVDGALCYRGAGPMRPLAALLQDAFTVYTYDRRGRGESSDTLAVRGRSRGRGPPGPHRARPVGRRSSMASPPVRRSPWRPRQPDPGISKLALYEPPFMAEVEDGPRIKELHRTAARAARRRAAGATPWRLFMTHVGVPAQAVAGIRAQPGWARLEAVAPTLAYDDEVLAGGRVPRRSGRHDRRPVAGSRRRRQPARAPAGGEGHRRTRCPLQSTGHWMARRTTWPRKHSHRCWSSSSGADPPLRRPCRARAPARRLARARRAGSASVLR